MGLADVLRDPAGLDFTVGFVDGQGRTRRLHDRRVVADVIPVPVCDNDLGDGQIAPSWRLSLITRGSAGASGARG